MSALTLVEAINLALHEEMERDGSVVVLGEDVGVSGGVFRATAGLHARFGSQRVLDTPLSESGFVGLAVGAALTGRVRPVVEIQFDTFVYPSGPADARWMLAAAVRHPDPVVFLEPKRLYRSLREEVPAALPAEVPPWSARLRRDGSDVVLISYGPCVPTCLEAAGALADEGVSAAVLDLRCLFPLDDDAILRAVHRTGRAVVVHEAPQSHGVGAEVAALVQQHALTSLLAPVQRVTGPDAQFPLMLNEHDYIPDVRRVLAAARRTLEF